MPETQNKPEIAPQRKVILLPPAIGDWTAYKPPKNYTKRIKSGLYGFDRFSEEKLEASLFIHYTYAQALFERLKLDLKTGTEVYSVAVEQTAYLNFLRSNTNPLVYCKLTSPDLPDPIMLCLELTLADSIINHALGMKDLNNPSRQLTEMENQVLQKIFDQYMPIYHTVFDNSIANLKLAIINSPDLRVENALSPNETFVSFQIQASIGGGAPGRITLGYTGKTLKKLLRKKSEKASLKPLDLRKIPPEILEKIRVPIRVQIGSTTLSSTEINNLENGDVVSMENKTDEAVLIHLGKNLILSAQPGTKSGKYSFRIVRLGAEERIKIAPAMTDAAAAETPAIEEAEMETPIEIETKPEESAAAGEDDWLKELGTGNEDLEFAEEGQKEEKSTDEEFKEEDWEKEFEIKEESTDKDKEDELWK